VSKILAEKEKNSTGGNIFWKIYRAWWQPGP